MHEVGYVCCCISFGICVSYNSVILYLEFFAKEVTANDDFIFAFFYVLSLLFCFLEFL
jgi:hypothetical protein